MSWMIIKNRRYHIPGDERSRTNPGHGYPDHIDTFQEAEIFSDEDMFQTKLRKLIKDKADFKVFLGNEMNIRTDMTIHLTPKED